MLPKNSKLLFRGIVGSQSYGLATETSDTDYKSIYLQSEEDILSNNYVGQIDIDKDDVAYELRRFLELVSTGNPNVLELLFLPEHCIINTSPEYEYLRENREVFLTKQCYYTYSGYAKTQLQKASGINKKFNWEENRIERKNIQDFSKIIDRQNGKTFLFKDWLKDNEYAPEQIGLTSIDGFRDCYRLYTDDIKWVSDNHRFAGIDLETRGYKGFGDENSNEPRKSEIEQYRINDWKGIVYFNREAYSTHCKEYREYENWLKNRNENRVATNKQHGQKFDSKNILHLVRLIMTAQEIPTENKINVDRTKNREYLLNIKKGNVDLKSIIEEWGQKAKDLEQLYLNSNLPEKVDINFTKQLELKIRKNEL
jgi:predicted nucleotidyltransferase